MLTALQFRVKNLCDKQPRLCGFALANTKQLTEGCNQEKCVVNCSEI